MNNNVFKLNTCESAVVGMCSLAMLFADVVAMNSNALFHNDLFIDFHSMREMETGVPYIWSLRKSGTWFAPSEVYFGIYDEIDYEPTHRFIVTRIGNMYEFTRIGTH